MNIHIKRLLAGFAFTAVALAIIRFVPEDVLGYGVLGLVGIGFAYLIGWGITD